MLIGIYKAPAVFNLSTTSFTSCLPTPFLREFLLVTTFCKYPLLPSYEPRAVPIISPFSSIRTLKSGFLSIKSLEVYQAIHFRDEIIFLPKFNKFLIVIDSYCPQLHEVSISNVLMSDLWIPEGLFLFSFPAFNFRFPAPLSEIEQDNLSRLARRTLNPFTCLPAGKSWFETGTLSKETGRGVTASL